MLYYIILYYIILYYILYYIVKRKGKVVPLLNYAPRHENVLGEWRYSSTHS
jgi:hypothetical protein